MNLTVAGPTVGSATPFVSGPDKSSLDLAASIFTLAEPKRSRNQASKREKLEATGAELGALGEFSPHGRDQRDLQHPWCEMTAQDPGLAKKGDSAHDARVSSFQRDLAGNDLQDVIRQHITTGNPVAIEADAYYQLRRTIARRFAVHPSAVILVGSCRTGFSLKPEKRYLPVAPDSDVDIAMVSPQQFDTYWDKVFDLARKDRGWARGRVGKRFASDLFSGWITPRHLPTLPRFSEGRAWAEFFDELTTRRTCGIREIKARLYRSWDRLEAYQEVMVSKCRNDLRKGEK
jgi:hypothetical protein